jgi:hypothetical protein
MFLFVSLKKITVKIKESIQIFSVFEEEKEEEGQFGSKIK